MMIALCIILFVVFFIFDFMPIVRQKSAKTTWIYGLLFTVSFVVLILNEMGVDIPSPAPAIEYFISTMLNLK
ncbi:MAG: hypothetical protein VB111_05825 [Clostridiaceae bacterium]|nr:hypothetical protein [Clostridiaceae bacterium]